MKHFLCASCGEMTNNYTWRRQRIICRRCWEIDCHDEVMFVLGDYGEEE